MQKLENEKNSKEIQKLENINKLLKNYKTLNKIFKEIILKISILNKKKYI